MWYDKINLSGDGFLLAGDAAQLIDPLQGHGIDKAMLSGIYAAQQAMTCFDLNCFDSNITKNYDQKIYNSIGVELARNKKITYLLYKIPWLVDLIASLIKITFLKKFFKMLF